MISGGLFTSYQPFFYAGGEPFILKHSQIELNQEVKLLWLG